MKTDNLNPPGQHAERIVRGYASSRRAGSSGIDWRDEAGTEVTASEVILSGLTLSEASDAALISAGGAVRQEFENATGTDLEVGDVVVIDDDGTVTTTTTPQDTRVIGVVQRFTPDGDPGPVALFGYVAQVNTTASVTGGNYAETSTAAGDATESATRRKGSFARYLATGSNPPALLFGVTDSVGTGSDSAWDEIITKSADQSVTNSSTLVNDSELSWPVLTGDSWRFELMVLYVTDATGDYKCDIAISASTMNLAYRYLGSDTTTNTVLLSTGIKETAVTNMTDIAAGGGSLSIVRQILIEGYLFASGNATVNFRFAQNTTTSGQSAVTKAGSRLLLLKLA